MKQNRSAQLMTEREFVAELRREYQSKGFTELHPRQVAESLRRAYHPDLAFKLGDQVDVIELKSKHRPQTAMQIRRLRKLVEAAQMAVSLYSRSEAPSRAADDHCGR